MLRSVYLYSLLAVVTECLSGPLHTSSRWILDSSNQRIKMRCINWGGHLETNIPEGLQHQAASAIAAQISSLPFNCVRLTYSIDMALAQNVAIEESFSHAADVSGADKASLMALHDDAIAHNPSLENGTVIDAFEHVVSALAEQNLMVILDNHVSRPGWCCNLTDGNGWWADAPNYFDATSRYFDTDRWLQGLGAMASWAKGHPNVVGMGIRNEIRGIPVLQDGPNRDVWFDRVARGIDAVTQANGNVLAVAGGTLGGTDFSFLRTRALDKSRWSDKVVWEYHIYSYSVGYSTGNCDIFKTQMGAAAGYLIQQGKPYTGPLWVSEFGFGMNSDGNGGLSDQDGKYLECLRGYLEGNDADWGLWAVQGDYYVRDGQIGSDEGYGLLTKDWSALRNSGIKSVLGKMWDTTQGP